MDLYEDELNDDYEFIRNETRMQPHGGQLMMTTQVTTKVHLDLMVRHHGLHLKMQ